MYVCTDAKCRKRRPLFLNGRCSCGAPVERDLSYAETMAAGEEPDPDPPAKPFNSNGDRMKEHHRP